jgi:hypothetical protein
MEVLRQSSAGVDTNNAALGICVVCDTLATYPASRVYCRPQAWPRVISLRDSQ